MHVQFADLLMCNDTPWMGKLNTIVGLSPYGGFKPHPAHVENVCEKFCSPFERHDIGIPGRFCGCSHKGVGHIFDTRIFCTARS